MTYQDDGGRLAAAAAFLPTSTGSVPEPIDTSPYQEDRPGMTLERIRGFVTTHPQLLTVPLVALVTWCALALQL